MVSKVSICSSASVLIGDDVISAIPGASRVSIVCSQLYDNAMNQLLSIYPWKFCKAQFSLNRLTLTPLFSEYKYAYLLPADFQRVIRTENNSDYKLHEKYLYSNQPSLNLEYTILPDEGNWPVYFVAVAEMKMAYLLSLSVAEDLSKTKGILSQFDKLMMQAKAVDSQNDPISYIDANILVNARFS